MADRDAYLLAPARRFYDGCLPAEKRSLDYILEFICEDPLPDGVIKLTVEVADGRILYRDDKFFALYRESNQWTVAVLTSDTPRTTSFSSTGRESNS